MYLNPVTIVRLFAAKQRDKITNLAVFRHKTWSVMSNHISYYSLGPNNEPLAIQWMAGVAYQKGGVVVVRSCSCRTAYDQKMIKS